MKYLILIGDGMSGRPLAELNGRTTLETARTPNIDLLLKHGKIGRVQNVPASMDPGSDVASMSIFGYDPVRSFTGRGPLEAAAHGIKMGRNAVAFRCNLVTIENEVMKDFTAGHIKTAEAKRLINVLNKNLSDSRIKFYPGVSYRHLAILKDGPLRAKFYPPHDITGKKITKYLPKTNEAKLINDLMLRSRDILKTQKTKATQIWLWGQGQKPNLTSITKKFRLQGSVITAVDLLKGIASYAGLDAIDVPGATGFLDTNYRGKVSAGLKALKKKDLLILHVEAPDECGHQGKIDLKIKAIEDFDRQVVGPLVKGLRAAQEPFRVLILPDHPTPIAIKTHSNEPVPFVYYDSTQEISGKYSKYSEKNASASKLFIRQGSTLLQRLINADF